MAKKKQRDWTCGSTGRANTSRQFDAIVADVSRMLRTIRVGDDTGFAAQGIVARLAHVHGLAPKRKAASR